MTPIILKRWIEVEPTMLTDDKQKPRIEHMLFLWHVEVRKGPKTGKVRTSRRRGFASFEGRNRREADAAVAKFCRKRNVRLLKEDFNPQPRSNE